MLSVNHGIVRAELSGPEELADDVLSVLVTMIDANRRHDVSDDMTEKVFMSLIVKAFQVADTSTSVSEEFKGRKR